MGFNYDRDKYPRYCLYLFLALWLVLAIKPLDRMDWFMENLFVFVSVPFFIWTYRKFRLSNLSYTLITVFMCLHIIGAHWTYAEVPLLNWLWPIVGATRNNYDRIVHFSFGLLLAYPIREVFLRIVNVRGFWGYYLPFDIVASFSAIYEIIEYATVLVVNPSLGMAYLGAQGDVWDAQKDMLMAITGALIAMIVTAIINARYKPDFARDFKSSFSVKHSAPLGEMKLAEYKRESELPKKRKTRNTKR